MQTDRRFVEHVQDAHQARADLSGEADTLRLTTGQGPGGAGERQVFEADVEQEAETCLNFLEHLTGDGLLATTQREAVQEVGAIGDRQFTDLGDRLHAELLVRDRDRQDLGGAQTRAATVRTGGGVSHVAVVAFLHLVRLGLLEAAVQEGHDALELGVVGTGTPVPVLVPDVDLLLTASRIARRAFAGSLFHGVFISKPRMSPSPDSRRPKYSELCPPIDHGAMAPSSRDSSGVGTTRSGSTSLRIPRPVHSGQARTGS